MSTTSVIPQYITAKGKTRKSIDDFKALLQNQEKLTEARQAISDSMDRSIQNPMVALRELDKAQSLVYPNNIVMMGKILATCSPSVVKWFAEVYIHQMEECARAGSSPQDTEDDSDALQMASQIGWIMILVNPDPKQLSHQFVTWRDSFVDASYQLDLEVIHEN